MGLNQGFNAKAFFDKKLLFVKKFRFYNKYTLFLDYQDIKQALFYKIITYFPKV